MLSQYINDPQLRLLLPFIIGLLRYGVITGGVYLFFYVWRRRAWLHRKIQQRFPNSDQIRQEVRHSLLTTLIFGFVALGVGAMRKAGYTMIYTDVQLYGWGYFGLSLLLLILLHDTYFYWTHRLMHLPSLFGVMHKTHHLSHNPTPFAALSFHWTEAIIEAGILPLAVLILPLHPLVILLFLLFMMAFNALGHSGFEWFGPGLNRHWLGRWVNTSTHHNLHHRYTKGNYGLYFIVWDRWMGTLHKDSDRVFDQVTEGYSKTTNILSRP